MAKKITTTGTQRVIAEVVLRLVGTAPILVRRPMPWDIGEPYWERQQPEVSKNRVRRPTQAELKTLAAISRNGFDLPCKAYDPTLGLDDYQEAIIRGHWIPGDWAPAFPVAGFLGAVTKGATQYNGKRYGLPATKLRSLIIAGDSKDQTLARIKTAGVDFAETIGVIPSSRAARQIIRIKYHLPWETKIQVRYSAALFTVDQIAQAFEWAGDFGIGSWRPSSPHGGQHGTFQVARK